MNVYDFDDTIYDGDCTFDFVKESLKRPACAFSMLFRCWSVIPFMLHIWDKTRFKSYFFAYLKHFKNIDQFLVDFTKRNQHKIKSFYLNQQKQDDVIISASPYFLVKGFCQNLGIQSIYGTDMNPYTGEIKGENCKGEAKVTLFKEVFKNQPIDCFYSDSKSDSPLARLAHNAFLVSGEKIEDWPKEWL